jgi:hypothetical protein
MNTRTIPPAALLLLSVGLMLPAASALALQPGRLADPPRDTSGEQVEAFYTPDLARWAGAYKAADEPRMLVIVGRWPLASLDQDLGRLRFAADNDAFATLLRLSLEEVLNTPEADADFVDAEAARAAQNRLSEILETSREREAIDLLGSTLGAEVVLVVRLVGRNADGSPSRVTFEAISTTRGTRLATFGFDWKLSASPVDVKQYARAIARKFIDDFSQRYAGQGQRFTLRLLGISDIETLEQARTLLRRVPGVVRVRTGSIVGSTDQRTGQSEASSELFVTFQDDALSLSNAAVSVLGQLQRVSVEPREIAGTTVTLRVTPGASLRTTQRPADACAEIILTDTPAGRQERAALSAGYARAGSPTLAVLVNRAADRDTRTTAGAPTGALTSENIIIVNAAGGDATSVTIPGDTTNATAADTRDIRAFELIASGMETAVLERLGVRLLNLATVDADTARARVLAAAGQKPGEALAADVGRFSALVRSSEVAKIAIYATGTITRDAGERDVTFSFKAVRVDDARVLATARVSAALPTGELDATIDRLATQAVAQIACDLQRAWAASESPSLELALLNATPEKAAALSEALRAAGIIRPVGDIEPPSADGTTPAKLRAAFTGDLLSLLTELRRVQSDVRFNINVREATPGRVVVDLAP